MNNRINVYPMIYKHRITKDGFVQVVLCITIANKPVFYDLITQTKFKIHISQWDATRKAIKNNKVLSQVIDNRKTYINNTLLKYELEGKNLNKKVIQDILEGKEPEKNFCDTCEEIISSRYGNVATQRSMRIAVNKLNEYREGLSFADIDYKFLSEFNTWMREKKSHSPNTIWKQFKAMNTFIRDAIKQGIVKYNPFDEFDRGKYKNPDRTFLLPDEVQKIEGLLLKENLPLHLVPVINYFLLMVYSGLRFEDAKRFNPKDHIYNDERILMETGKAKVILNLKLYPKLKSVVDNLGGKLSLSNQKFNDHLKTIAELAKVNKNLTAHIARHTFGMTLADKGVSIEIAQRLLAHKDSDSTKIYYHMRGKVLDDEIDKKFG